MTALLHVLYSVFLPKANPNLIRMYILTNEIFELTYYNSNYIYIMLSNILYVSTCILEKN